MKDAFNAVLLLGMGFLPYIGVSCILSLLKSAEITIPDGVSYVIVTVTLLANVYWAKIWIGHPEIAALNKKSSKYFKGNGEV